MRIGQLLVSLETTTAAIGQAATPEAAAAAAMQYLAGRFCHAVWFAIREGTALGEHGNGGQLTDEVVQAIAVPLAAPSIVQRAHATRQLVTAPPADAGAIQDRLARALGHPAICAAMPIEVDGRVAVVIAVGAPQGRAVTAAGDLELLGRALGATYRRMSAR